MNLSKQIGLLVLWQQVGRVGHGQIHEPQTDDDQHDTTDPLHVGTLAAKLGKAMI